MSTDTVGSRLAVSCAAGPPWNVIQPPDTPRGILLAAFGEFAGTTAAVTISEMPAVSELPRAERSAQRRTSRFVVHGREIAIDVVIDGVGNATALVQPIDGLLGSLRFRSE